MAKPHKYSSKYGKNPRNVGFNQPVDQKFSDLIRKGKPPGGSVTFVRVKPKGN